MRKYKNLSERSGVAQYEYDTTSFGWITVQFKDGSIYSYTAETCGMNNVFEMISLAEIGRGLNRHINYYQPGYILGRLTSANMPQIGNVQVGNYPSINVKQVKWDTDNAEPTWFRVEYKNGQSTTYTIESCGSRNLAKLVQLAKKGYGLLAWIKNEQPKSVEDVSNEQ